ncbi:MAG: hypothetical protein QM710_11865 [Flavobacterium sp.]
MDVSSKRFKIVYWSLLSAYVLLLLAINLRMYLPWFDEVFFSSISSGIIHNGMLHPTISMDPGETVLTYGPTGFYAQAFFFRIFGEGFFIGRAVNLFFGLSLFGLLFHWIRQNAQQYFAYLFLVLVLLDSSVLSMLLVGRLDYVGVFLFALGLYVFTKNRNNLYIILSGILIALSFLSSPRLGAFIIALAGLFLIELISKKEKPGNLFLQYLKLLIVIMAPIFTWIWMEFGGIKGYVELYTSNQIVMEHVGGIGIPKFYQLFLLACMAGLFVYAKIKKAPIHNLSVVFFILVVLHMILNKKPEPYSAMMMPFLYFGILLQLNDLNFIRFKYISHFAALYMLPFLLLISLKIALTFNNFPERNAAAYKQVIADNPMLSGKKRVLCSYKYYYMLKSLGANPAAFDHNYTYKRINGKSLAGFDYLLLDKQSLKNLKKISDVDAYDITPLKLESKIVSLPSQMEQYSFDYNGWILTKKQ